MEKYRKFIIGEIIKVLEKCSISTLEYIRQFTQAAHNEWDK